MTDRIDEQPGKIFAAILAVKRAMASEGVGKGQRNSQQNYNFRGIDDIMNAMAAPLVNAGIIVVPQTKSRIETVAEIQSSSGRAQRLTSVTLDTDFVFVADDGSSLTARIQSEASDYADKATNKAMSAGLKYAFLQVFNIPVVGAEDGDFESPGNEVHSIHGDTGEVVYAEPAKKAAAKKATPKAAPKAAPQAATSHPIVAMLDRLNPDVANKVAALIQKAYNVTTVVNVPEAKVQEAIGRIDGYLKKAQEKPAAKPVAAKAAAPAQASYATEIPE